MSITNKTAYHLVVELCQAFPLYYENNLHPDATMYRSTGAVHFTVKCSITGADGDGKGSAALGTYFLFGSAASPGWYAGYNHELEIHGGGDEKFRILDTKWSRWYTL